METIFSQARCEQREYARVELWRFDWNARPGGRPQRASAFRGGLQIGKDGYGNGAVAQKRVTHTNRVVMMGFSPSITRKLNYSQQTITSARWLAYFDRRNTPWRSEHLAGVSQALV